MSTIPKVRPEAPSGQAVPEQELLLPVPRLKELQALERQAQALGYGLEEWLLCLLRANVRTFRVDPPQAQLVLHLDTGTRRLLEWHAGTLGHTLNGLVGCALEDVHCTRLSHLRQLHAARWEPREIAFAVLSQGRA